MGNESFYWYMNGLIFATDYDTDQLDPLEVFIGSSMQLEIGLQVGAVRTKQTLEEALDHGNITAVSRLSVPVQVLRKLRKRISREVHANQTF